ncbi:hypothetical protein C8Q78DRAFT_402207 [Trametes maxima]|nr:hypothetical protein C8Q78DRAFT_402207 [Trametes maxima]
MHQTPRPARVRPRRQATATARAPPCARDPPRPPRAQNANPAPRPSPSPSPSPPPSQVRVTRLCRRRARHRHRHPRPAPASRRARSANASAGAGRTATGAASDGTASARSASRATTASRTRRAGWRRASVRRGAVAGLAGSRRRTMGVWVGSRAPGDALPLPLPLPGERVGASVGGTAMWLLGRAVPRLRRRLAGDRPTNRQTSSLSPRPHSLDHTTPHHTASIRCRAERTREDRTLSNVPPIVPQHTPQPYPRLIFLFFPLPSYLFFPPFDLRCFLSLASRHFYYFPTPPPRARESCARSYFFFPPFTCMRRCAAFIPAHPPHLAALPLTYFRSPPTALRCTACTL